MTTDDTPAAGLLALADDPVEIIARAICTPVLHEFDGYRLDRRVAFEGLPEADKAALYRASQAAVDALRARANPSTTRSDK